jgi:hypothetical protein
MLILVIGFTMFLALAVGVYLGFKEKYNANEGTLALLVLETFFVSIGLIIYGLAKLF